VGMVRDPNAAPPVVLLPGEVVIRDPCIATISNLTYSLTGCASGRWPVRIFLIQRRKEQIT